MKFVNLTRNTITFVDAEGDIIRAIKPCGSVATVNLSPVQLGNVDDIPITANLDKGVANLPDPEEGVIYIVPAIVAGNKELKSRRDVFAPGEQVRDEQGKVIGCRSLQWCGGDCC